MKKFILNILTSAIALTGLVILTACADENVEQTQGGERPTSEVPVKFVFNVSTSTGGGQTRMTSGIVQNDGSFRGIADARILAYQLKDGNDNATNGKYVTDFVKAQRIYDLADIVGSGDISKENSSRVIEISLPNGANTLMFYGKAPKGLGDSANVKQGAINSFVFEDNTEDKTMFKLVPRIAQYELDGNGNDTEVETTQYKIWTQVRKLLTTILNRITSNGLRIESVLGTNGVRDLRAHIWWPQREVTNYDLNGPVVDLSKLVPAGTGVVPVGTDNSNIAEVVYGKDGGADAQVVLKYKDASGAEQSCTLNYVASTKRMTTNVDTYDFSIFEADWKDYGAAILKPNNNLTPLEEILGRVYNSFTIMKTNEQGYTEIRAGSSQAIIRMVEDLWTVTNQVKTAVPTSVPEARAQAMAERLYNRFSAYFTADVDERTGLVKNCRLKSPHDLVQEILKYCDSDALTAYAEIKDFTSTEHINTFPTCSLLKMPAGSTQLTCRDGVYSYNETMAAYGMGMTDVSPLKYTWPVELCYYGNSPLRTSDKTLDNMSFPHTAADWSNDEVWAQMKDNSQSVWTGDYVSPLTRSVAMKYNINYATALLATSIYYDAEELEDNNSNLHPGEENKLIRVTDNPRYSIGEESRFGGQKFELTGVVVGGQPLEVGWNFLQKTSNPKNTFTYMVYDNEVPKNGGTWGAKIPGYSESKSLSDYNYTLLWDNWNQAQINASQDPVYVALEFRNCSGTDFWGTDNLIPDGGTFYLIGKLDPNVKYDNATQTTKKLSETDLSEGIIWPADGTQALPPFDANGNTIKQRRVFIQGYKTIARFGLGKRSLQNAYLTVPDLRSANISLGLSVDIDWKPGLEYNVVIGE